jgi:hypothetical protein
MTITQIQVTPSGVVVIDGINDKGEEDCWYITEQRLLKALSRVSTDDGMVMQASKRKPEGGTRIEVRVVR